MYANLKTMKQSLALPLKLRTEAGIVANPGPKDYYDAGWREVMPALELEAGRVETGRRLEYNAEADAFAVVVDSVSSETYDSDRAAAVKAEADKDRTELNARVSELPVIIDLLARVKALEDAAAAAEREK